MKTPERRRRLPLALAAAGTALALTDGLRPEGSDDVAGTLGARAAKELTRMAGVVDEGATWQCPEVRRR